MLSSLSRGLFHAPLLHKPRWCMKRYLKMKKGARWRQRGSKPPLLESSEHRPVNHRRRPTSSPQPHAPRSVAPVRELDSSLASAAAREAVLHRQLGEAHATLSALETGAAALQLRQAGTSAELQATSAELKARLLRRCVAAIQGQKRRAYHAWRRAADGRVVSLHRHWVAHGACRRLMARGRFSALKRRFELWRLGAYLDHAADAAAEAVLNAEAAAQETEAAAQEAAKAAAAAAQVAVLKTESAAHEAAQAAAAAAQAAAATLRLPSR